MAGMPFYRQRSSAGNRVLKAMEVVESVAAVLERV
jgi:hypothetical protein